MVEFGRHRRLKISRLVRPGSSPGGGTIYKGNLTGKFLREIIVILTLKDYL